MGSAFIQPDGLTIGEQSYRSSGFGELLRILGVAGGLEIVDAASTRDPEDSRNLSITGTVTLFDAKVADVELYLDYSAGETFEFQLSGTLATCSLAMLQERGILPAHGLNAIAQLLEHRFSDVSLVYDSLGQRLYFGQVESTLTLDALQELGLSLERLGFEFLRSYSENSAALILHAGIAVGSVAFDTTLRLPLGGLIPAGAWALTVDRPIQLTAGTADLVSFLEKAGAAQALQVGSLKDLLPPQLHTIPTLFLETLEVQIDPQRKRLNLVACELASTYSTKIGDLFSIDKIGMRAVLNLTAARPAASIALTGSIALGERLSVGLSVVLPTQADEDWLFTIDAALDLSSIAAITKLPINTPLEELALPVGLLKAQQLRLNLFEVVFNPAQRKLKTIAVDLIVYLEIDLVHHFTLKNPRFTLMIDNPFSKAGAGGMNPEPRVVQGSIAGTITIGAGTAAPINIALAASLNGPTWQFSGQTEPRAIPIGDLTAALFHEFNVEVPSFVHGLTLEQLTLSFTTTRDQADQPNGATASKNLIFTCRGRLPIGPAEHPEGSVVTMVTIEVTGTTGKYTYKVSGHFEVAVEGLPTPLLFDLSYLDSREQALLTGFYSHTGPRQGISLGALARAVSQSSLNLPASLDTLSIDLRSLLFGYLKKQGQAGAPATAKYLFGLDFGIGLSLSNLPLVGKEFPRSQTAGIDNLRLLIADRPFSATETAQLNQRIPQGVMPLPMPALPAPGGQPAGNQPQADPVALPAGLTFAATFNFGGTPQPLALPTSGASVPGAGTTTPPSVANPVGVTPADSATWFTIQRSFGPLQLRRLGAQYRAGAVWFLLDAALGAAGLTLALDGLGIGLPLSALSDLKSLRPSFDLRGLGIAYQSSAVEIGGAFLRVQRTGEPDEYDGAAVVKASALTLSALGSYTTRAGQPSMFVYAVLDYPIGGPAFFFVTGLAAGFGYNRALHAPPIEQVATFPLVSVALKPPAPSGGQPAGGDPAKPDRQGEAAALAAILGSLQRFIPPSVGDSFLAIGVKFTSFKLIESFALLTVAFGHRVEINLLGLATYRAPPPLPGEQVDPVAEVQLALKASFIPDEGFLSLSAQLTSASYILSRSCHLTGGFAFYCWFPSTSGAPTPHAGDFVLTLGGYHPAFNVPAHYPRVPRLGLNWQVDERLSVKGEAYCALVPSALMAGGLLQAVWSSDAIKAWFSAGADFIIAWRPYHYDAYAFVQVQASYTIQVFGTHTLSIAASANLHIWGPKFSGVAHIKVAVVSFQVTFGDARQETKALVWDEFQKSFLPAPSDPAGLDSSKPVLNQCCSIIVSAGLLHKGDSTKGDLGIIDPERLVLMTNSVIPSSAVSVSGATLDGGQSFPSFGIAPMDVGALESIHEVSIISQHGALAADGLRCTPVRKDVPSALWGTSSTPQISGSGLVAGAVAGLAIKPAVAEAHQSPVILKPNNWQYQTTDFPSAARWERAEAVPAQGGARPLASPGAADARAAVLAALKLTPHQAET